MWETDKDAQRWKFNIKPRKKTVTTNSQTEHILFNLETEIKEQKAEKQQKNNIKKSYYILKCDAYTNVNSYAYNDTLSER